MTIYSVSGTIYKYFVSPATNRNQKKKESLDMQIDKKLDFPDGSIHFRGELTEQEVEQVIEWGLIYGVLLGAIPAELTPNTATENVH